MRIPLAAAAACALAAATVPSSCPGEETFVPPRPPQVDQIIDVGTDVGHVLDGLPIEGEAAGAAARGDADDSGATGAGRYVTIMVAGVVGLAFFVYGRKQANAAFVISGALLMVYPYAVTDTVAMVILGAVLCASPWALRWARIGT